MSSRVDHLDTRGEERRDAASTIMDDHGDLIREWEDADNRILRALARVIRDHADGNGGGGR